MKKFFYLLLIPLCMGMVACSSDDDDSSGNEPANKLTEAQRKFVGFWHRKDGNEDFLFNADGTCKKYSRGYENETGEWSYDELTKKLASTMNGCQWVVSISTDNAWSGVNIASGESPSFIRSNLYWFFSSYLCHNKWKKKDGSNSDYIDFLGYKYRSWFQNESINLVGDTEDKGFNTLGFVVQPTGEKEIANELKGNLEETYYGNNIFSFVLNEEYTNANMTIKNCNHSDGVFTAEIQQTLKHTYMVTIKDDYWETESTDWCVVNIGIKGTIKLINADSNSATLTVTGEQVFESEFGSFVKSSPFNAEYIISK